MKNWLLLLVGVELLIWVPGANENQLIPAVFAYGRQPQRKKRAK
jgi:hypothetical protein